MNDALEEAADALAVFRNAGAEDWAQVAAREIAALTAVRDKCAAENEAVFFHRAPAELPPLPEGKPLVAALPYQGPRLSVAAVGAEAGGGPAAAADIGAATQSEGGEEGGASAYQETLAAGS